MRLLNQGLLSTVFLLVCLAIVPAIQAQQSDSIDILLKGGHVIDPKNRIDSKMDVAVFRGKISQVAANISEKYAKKVVDVTGMYVTPGLIDMHVHVFHGTEEPAFNGFHITNSFGSVSPDDFTFRAGVTTVVDAGSSGWRNFYLFKKQTIDHSRTRVLAFLSIAGNSMLGTVHSQDLSDINPQPVAFTVKEYPDIIVGIKSHHYQGPDFQQVDRAVEAGKIANVPVMVDFGGTIPPLSIKELFMKHLRPGDIFTHTYAYSLPRRESVVDSNDKVKPFVFAAQKRGIIFDVGHGAGAFVWHVAINSIKQGFLPNSISSDLYGSSKNAGLKDFTNLLSKFLNMGLTIQDVIVRATWNPANEIKRPDLGSLTVGSEADVAVLSITKGDYGFTDAHATKMKGTQKIAAELTLRAGRIVWDLNGISAAMWDAKNPKK